MSEARTVGTRLAMELMTVLRSYQQKLEDLQDLLEEGAEGDKFVGDIISAVVNCRNSLKNDVL